MVASNQIRMFIFKPHFGCKSSAPSSVTRFGKILPLWQKFTSLWQIFEGLFLIWQNAEHTLANL